MSTRALGLLQRKKLVLKITENLSDAVWHKIMHADSEILIEVAPGVSVPEDYRGFVAGNLEANSPMAWEGTADLAFSKGGVVVAEDLVGAEKLLERLLDDPLIYHASRETSASDLIEEVMLVGEGHFHWKMKEVYEALAEGRDVVVSVPQENKILPRELESFLGKDAYGVVNGVRTSIKGRLFILMSNSTDLSTMTGPRFRVDEDFRSVAHAITAQRLHLYNDEQAQKMVDFLVTAQKYYQVPVSLYNEALEWAGYKDILEGFDQVIRPHIASDEAAAFLRVSLRINFKTKSTGSNRIDGEALERLINQVRIDGPWKGVVWQMADAMSDDLLSTPGITQAKFSEVPSGVITKIREALVKKYEIANISGLPRKESLARAKALRKFFNIEGDMADAPDISFERPDSLKERFEATVTALLNAPGAMLIGLPGVGKSFTVKEVCKDPRLGYTDKEIMDPFTVGPDIMIEDIEDKLEAWAKLPNGGVLIVDEGNLAKRGFWEFLRGLSSSKPHIWIKGKRYTLTSRHKVIFTGNPYTFAGRQRHAFIDDVLITVPFETLSREDYKKIITVNNYIPSTMARGEGLIDKILDIHSEFERVAGEGNFSLRDIQDVVNRLLVDDRNSWTDKSVVMAAWSVYRGHNRAMRDEEGKIPGLPKAEHFSAGRSFRVGDIDVSPFTIPHDAADPVGFTFRAEGIKIGFATDLGYMPVSVRNHLLRFDRISDGVESRRRDAAHGPISLVRQAARDEPRRASLE